MLLFGLTLFIAATLGCAVADNVQTLIVLRFLEAVGGAAGPVLARAAVRDLYGGDRAARVLSTMVLIMGAAPLLAPIVGGQLLLIAGWRAIFWALCSYGVVCLAVVVFVIGETLPSERRLTISAFGMIRSYGMLLGDKRYNDRWSDFSQAGIDADLKASADFLQRFEAIDTAGFPLQEQLNRELMLRQLHQNVDGAHFKDWEMPLAQNSGVHIDTPMIISALSF